ncbi:MAG TPA: hypothetical protein VIL78_08250 [Hanamia sp.]
MSASLLNNTTRNVIPRWRGFNETLSLGELSPISDPNFVTNTDFINSTQHQQKIFDWKINKTISNAIELLNSSYIVDDQENLSETASFLKSGQLNIAPSIRHFSNKILLINPLKVEPEPNTSFENFDSIIGGLIKKFRQSVSINQNNPISWLELARLYLIIGKEKAAERCIFVGLQLAPDNRYVSRVVSRYFTHYGDLKMARKVLKLNTAFSLDPWLISADIGISTLYNKSSFHIKRGTELINSKNYSAYDLNELFSALATQELHAGSVKNSRKLYNDSLINPNDNSLAQAVWAKSQITDLNLTQSTFEKVSHISEAKAYFYFNSKKWNQAYSNTIQWFIDQPFSRDPAGFGSFIASSILEKYDDAIKISQYGLKATPGDFTLMNNLAYSYLKKNDTATAHSIINKINPQALNDREKVIYSATKGLLMYKLGHTETGEKLYNEASQFADKIKDKKLKLLADFNHLSIQLESEGFPAYQLSKIDRISEEMKGVKEEYLNTLVENLKKRISLFKNG